ncbi:MAG: hypothetical protein ACOYNI_12685 [Acidimicrobiia bacterium]
MASSLLKRRLVDVADRLKRQRAELVVAEEQLRVVEDDAEDARLRALVSETPLADVEAREARRHADALARHRDALVRSIADLVAEQDALLDKIASELPSDA